MAKQHRGLGSNRIDPDRKQAIQRKGGLSSPQNFAKNRQLAKSAGKKGGRLSPGNFKHNPERASEAGRKGGKSKKNLTAFSPS